MSFDLMRRHRRKVEIPLAIFVVITFVLFFGISGIDKVFAERQRYDAADTTEEQGRLLVLGRDLARIGMLREPPKEIWDYDDKDAEKRKQSLQVRADYTNAVRQLYEAPVKMAGELGIRVSDEDLARELKQRLSREWGLTQKAGETAEQYLQRYEKLLKGRDLTKQRFEELVRGQMTIERLTQMMSAAGAASEAEMYRFYADANQKVRVQYFQRRTADFVKVVEEASRLEAAGAAKPADPAGKEEARDGDAEKAEKKDGAAGKPESKGVSEDDIRKRFDGDMLQLKSAAPRPGESWDSRAVSWRPEYFSRERARVEYLVALREKFAKDVEVKPEEIEQYYKNNEYKYREEPKADDKARDDAKKDEGKDAKAGEEPKPKIKPLDDKLKAEIRKTLVERKAIEKAEAALEAAVKEYNDADPEKRPALGALVARHNLETLGTSALAERDDLEALPQLKGAPWLVGQVFSESSREKLGGKFTETVRTRADDKDQDKDKEEVASAVVALRVAEFQPGKLRDFEDVKATVRERLVIEKALKLAREAAEADRKLLVEGKLDPKLVRLSEVLDSQSQTAARTADLAVGEASEPFAYRELLGEEAAAEKKKEEQKEKEKAKDGAGKKEKPDLADDYSRGYRVVILAERVVPAIDEFRKDGEWMSRWSPEASSRFEGLPPEYREYFMNQMLRQSPNLQWRSFYASEWVRTRCEKAMLSDR